MTVQIKSAYITPYDGERDSIESAFNHTALEALLRAVEDDNGIHGHGSEGYLDIRAMDSNEAMLDIRIVIRADSFILDLVKNRNSLQPPLKHATPYGRDVKRTWSSNDWAVRTAKGWVVFDYPVHTQVH